MASSPPVEEAGTALANLATGSIELEVTDLEIFNRSETPPFQIADQCDTGENIRLQYRYLDLRRPEGADILKRFVATSDVLIENFPTGGLRKYGLDWASVKTGNERLIYVSCTGFGQKGPMASRKGYDTVFQAMGGLMSLTGEKGGGPVKPGLPIADLSSGLWIAIGILSMLAGRTQTGRGGYLDFAMLDGQISLLTLAAARHFALGEVPARLGTEHPGRVPSATFRCRDGGFVHITGADQHWAPLCDLLDLADWGAEPRFATNSGRVRHRAEVMERLTRASCPSRLTRRVIAIATSATSRPSSARTLGATGRCAVRGRHDGS